MPYSYDQQTKEPHFRKFFARLKKAMSVENALEVLGFPPDAHPSEPEIQRAYRQKAIENHPDRGGTHEKMVEVNVAKEVLDGKQRPTYERSPAPAYSPSTGYGYNPSYAHPESPPVKEVVTFDAAKAKGSVPAGVDWLFVTDMQRGRSNYSGDESSSSKIGWVVVGETSTKYVFVGVEHSTYSANFIGGGGGHDKWAIRSQEYTKPAAVTPSWLYGNVVRAMKDMEWVDGRFNSKVRDCRGETFDEALLRKRGATVSIKHMMVELGMVGEDDAAVANRKHVVEIKVDRDLGFEEKIKPGFYPDPNPARMHEGKYTGDYYKVTLILNGKEVVLSQSDWEKFAKLRLNKVSVLELCEGLYGKKKTITRMPKGKIILNALAEKMTDLPNTAKEVLQKAAEQMKA